MGGLWDKWFKKTWSLNTPLAKVGEDVRKLGKDLTEQYHIVIEGGAGNSLYINPDYSIAKDIDFIADRTKNTNVGFVNLLRIYDKQWMNWRVWSVNLGSDRALMRRDMSHTNVTVTDTIVGEEHTTHDLHFNSRGKMRLTHLTAGICQVGTVVFL
jgi:hypothetical protein